MYITKMFGIEPTTYNVKGIATVKSYRYMHIYYPTNIINAKDCMCVWMFVSTYFRNGCTDLDELSFIIDIIRDLK